MAISKDRFREALNEFYSKEILFKLYTKYFLDWIAEGYIGSNLGLFEISLISENSNKQTFLDLLEQFYLKEEIFCTIYERLDSDVKEVFEEVVWKGKFYISNKERYLKLENNYDLNKDLQDKFLFFKAERDNKKGEYLYLDYDILRVIRKFMRNKPQEYNIIAQNSVDAALVNNNEKELIENFKMYFEFYSQGGIKLSSSAKILKESKLNMKKYCNISEYYEDSKDLDYLKTETIALFFFLVKERYIDENYFKISNIKNIVNDFLSGELIKEENYHYTSLYLNYLKGVKNIWKSKEEIKRGLATIKNILNEIPNGKVVSVDNIIKSILYRDEFIEIIDVKDAYDYIYINEANYERTKILNYEKYQMYVVIPFIKSVLFILGVLGVLEIYYDYPSINNSLYLKNGYLSKFDGIKYIKFTELGEYCFDRIEEYDFKNAKEDGEVILDEDRLIATIVGDAPVKTMFLERVSQKIAVNKFKFNKESFLKGISSSKEIQDRINEFYSKITPEPSQIWVEFFGDLLEKSSAIKADNQFVVLKLKNDKELIKTITKDERFKPLMLKGEDFHLLIKSENVTEVVSLFKEHGYYVNF
ncbi:hypothetical protein [Fusobacterium sp.]|uniref:hypothetical protein n=1 Tax=Fusobacterium sp. TaxID=68766 RepID=UPI0025B7E7FB|nr:hypothetical protein [Fusobacterium sp.]